jgi:hypothetical protein
LFRAVFCGRLSFIETLEVAVVAFVEAPMPLDPARGA